MADGGIDGTHVRPQEPPERAALDPRSIVDSAARIVEDRGLGAFTMAAVARDLGAPVTSVHWHFRTKADLLDAVAERVALEFYDALPPVASERAWDAELAHYCRAMRHQLLTSSAFLDLSLDRGGELLSRPRVRRTINTRLEAELAPLVQSGLAPADAYRLYNTCSNYVRGFVILERAHAVPSSHEREPQYVDPAAFPLLAQIPDLGALSWRDTDAQFELGLTMLLAGMRERLTTSTARTEDIPRT